MGILAVAQGLSELLGAFASEGGEGGAGLTINFFWIIVSALNFIVFFFLVYRIVLIPVGGMLKDRQAILGEARREASEILARSQRLSDEAREVGIAETQAEIDRLRERAVVDIDAERQRAMSDVRSQVAELALAVAGKVVGETMTDERERRLVHDFLAQVSPVPPTRAERN